MSNRRYPVLLDVDELDLVVESLAVLESMDGLPLFLSLTEDIPRVGERTHALGTRLGGVLEDVLQLEPLEGLTDSGPAGSLEA